MRKEPLEKVIEKKVCDHAKALGWLVYKFVSPSCAGVPDRVFIRAGKVVFVEFKTRGKKPTNLQTYQIERMRRQGMEVLVIDNVDAGKAYFDGQELI